MTRIPISIVVVCRDRPEHVARCLASLAAQSTRRGRDFEIIVVEQGGASRTAARAVGAKYIGLPHGDAIRKPWLCNIGARAAKFQWLYQVDCDTILERRAVRKIQAEIASGRLGDRVYATTMLNDLNKIETDTVQRHPSLKLDTRWGTVHGDGNPVLMPRAYYAWLGGMDEEFYGHGCHDLDLIERVKRTGGEVRVLPVQAWHQWHGRTLKRTAVWHNWRRYRILRRKMRGNAGLAIRNSGRWGRLPSKDQAAKRTKIRPKRTRAQLRSRRRETL